MRVRVPSAVHCTEEGVENGKDDRIAAGLVAEEAFEACARRALDGACGLTRVKDVERWTPKLDLEEGDFWIELAFGHRRVKVDVKRGNRRENACFVALSSARAFKGDYYALVWTDRGPDGWIMLPADVVKSRIADAMLENRIERHPDSGNPGLWFRRGSYQGAESASAFFERVRRPD